MSGFLAGRTVGFLVAQDGTEEKELDVPRRALEEAGAVTMLIAPRLGQVTTAVGGVPNGARRVDRAISAVSSHELDALVLPDGEGNSVALRRELEVVRLLGVFAGSGKPVGAFGFALWSLLDAGMISGRQVTSHPALRHDLVREGALWRDQRVVVDANLITSRSLRDVDAFTIQLVAYLDR